MIFVVCATFLSAALTASVFTVKRAFTFDPFAEVTIINDSGLLISLVEIKQGKLTISSQGILPNEKCPICFYSDPTSSSHRYSVSVHFVDGHSLHADANVINNGEKHEVNISKDWINTGYVRSTSLWRIHDPTNKS